MTGRCQVRVDHNSAWEPLDALASDLRAIVFFLFQVFKEKTTYPKRY